MSEKTPDMNKDQKIEAILNSLEGMDRASPGPFFYTRLRARMENAAGLTDKILFYITRPAVGIAAVLLIIVINAVAIFMATPANENGGTATTEIASVDEYSQANLTFFDVEK